MNTAILMKVMMILNTEDEKHASAVMLLSRFRAERNAAASEGKPLAVTIDKLFIDLISLLCVSSGIDHEKMAKDSDLLLAVLSQEVKK